MASSSSSPLLKYDVFVSFNVRDTGDNIVSHLLQALHTSKIQTFIDDEFKRGDEISPALITAIQESKISVIIFSKNYATSKRCLDELVKILECSLTLNRIVVPVFYEVDPSDVRNQTGKFGTAFRGLEQNYQRKEGWRIALTDAGRLAGWESSKIRSEAILVKEIVAYVLQMLTKGSNNDGDSGRLIGTKSRIDKIMGLLRIDESPDDFVMVGIWGMAGAGKTTIAKEVFNHLSGRFNSYCFLENVRKKTKKEGLSSMRSNLISNLLTDKTLEKRTPHIGDSSTNQRLRRTKVLVVLDDVNDSSQLEELIGKCGISKEPFGPGSRVIVTTRDKQILDAHDIKDVYEMELLHEDEALQLFNYHALSQNQLIELYPEISKKIVEYAKGVPLALKVIGSSLCGTTDIRDWERALNVLNKHLTMNISLVLKTYFNRLEDEEKDVFLDTEKKHVILDTEEKDITNVYDMEFLHDKDALHFLSSSSSIFSTKNDVFLSFRGKDTRDSIVSHLDHALKTKEIETFIDHDEPLRVDEISQNLIIAIEKSKISLIIFSENYGDSERCLDELVKILECRRHQIVLPVFYNVEPTHVRNQTGKFGTAFDRLLENITASKLATKEQIWRRALKYAGQLSGLVSYETRSEATLVDTIIAYVSEKLEMDSTNAFFDDTGLVGINSRTKQIISLLCIGRPEFGMVGIWGMGGIGKTTIAKAIFKRISCKFESCCFLENVREKAKKDGLISKRDDLISELLKHKKLEIGTPHIGDASIKEKLEIGTPHNGDAFIKDSLRSRRVLVVLDGVEDLFQLEDLIGLPGTVPFGPGSRVIVTTRDKQVLNAHDITDVYEMEMLHDDESLTLFHYHALRYGQPADPYLEISKKIVEYAKGVPLALKLFGSSLSEKIELGDWEGVLNKLNKAPNMIISAVLKKSYDRLDDEEKNIFLDIARFFKGTSIDTVTNVLDGCYCSVHLGIRALIDKSLMNISHRNSTIWSLAGDDSIDVVEMHDLVQEMGRNIVIGEFENAGSRSRLWRPKEVWDVLTSNTGTGKIKGILFDMSEVNKMTLAPQTLEKMYNLNFLKIMDSSTTYTEDSSTDSEMDFDNSLSSESKIQFPSGLKSLPNGLKYLYWQNYPLECLPPTFKPTNLVELHLIDSPLKQLWSGTQNLDNLKVLCLRFCTKLIEIPDLSLAKNLEELRITSCESLVELPSSIQLLKNLLKLDISNCSKLDSIPNDINGISLTHLNFYGCPKITKFTYLSKNIKFLRVSGMGKTTIAMEKMEIGSNNSYDDTGLFGINSRMEKIISLLRIEWPPSGFRMVGIWGMGGIGKTTIAQAVFNKISSEFESCCFLRNVRERAKKEGVARMTDNLISELLKAKKSAYGLPYITGRLKRIRVLIVLDDVDDLLQLEGLIGGCGTDPFGPGSRVMVTTRDNQILRAHDIKDEHVYDMEILDDDQALQLFSYHAFPQTQPVEPYLEFSKKMVEYAKGVPLALKVLASSLRGKTDPQIWEGALRKLRNVPDPRISDVLKRSYDSLGDEEKNIFLDIACFFRHERVDKVRNVLDGCYHSGCSGMDVLLDKSLISYKTYSRFEYDRCDTVEMHDLVQEIGWNIVDGESLKVGSRSRLWRYEDVCDVLTRNTGTKNVKAILFDTQFVNQMSLAPETFEKMYNLKFLKIMHSRGISKIKFPSGLKLLPEGLRYLCWEGYPLEYLPPTFNPNHLVELLISSSSLKRLWTGKQNLYNLKAIRLLCCFHLTEFPDLSLARNLKEITIQWCPYLVKIPSSIQYLKNITHLNFYRCMGLVEIPSFIKHFNNLISLTLNACKNLERIPNDINCISLTHLSLFDCPKITKFPYLSKNIRSLYVDGSLMEQDLSSIAFFTELVTLQLWNCTDYQKSPAFLERIKVLTPSNCQITF